MNENMQDILKNYYSAGGNKLFESPEVVEEGVFTTAMVFAGLVSLLSGGPKVDPIQSGLNSEVNHIVQDIQKDTLDSFKYDPDVIAKTFGVDVKYILDPEFSKDSGRPRAGYNPASDGGLQHISTSSVRVDYSKNQMDSKKISPVYNYGDYYINVIRSSKPIQETVLNPDMDLKETVYLTACLLEATVNRNGNLYHADKFLNFYHVYNKDINNMDKCNPKLIIDQLESAFKTNPLLIDPNRP